jgi:hypothetical protein
MHGGRVKIPSHDHKCVKLREPAASDKRSLPRPVQRPDLTGARKGYEPAPYAGEKQEILHV